MREIRRGGQREEVLEMSDPIWISAANAHHPESALRKIRADFGVETKGGHMNDSIGEHAVAVGGEMTITRPLDHARAISGLISEEALASERLGRLTDKVAAALLDANLLSILVPRADGGLGGTGVELF